MTFVFLRGDCQSHQCLHSSDHGNYVHRQKVDFLVALSEKIFSLEATEESRASEGHNA